MKPMRSATNSVFGGVCGGLAELWGLSPRRMRVVWVIATLGTAFAGGIVYLLLWYLLPKAPLAPLPFEPAVNQPWRNA